MRTIKNGEEYWTGDGWSAAQDDAYRWASRIDAELARDGMSGVLGQTESRIVRLVARPVATSRGADFVVAQANSKPAPLRRAR